VQGKNVTGTMCRDVENGKDNENLHLWELGREMLKLTGYLPLIGDKHLAEFFPYYLTNPCNNGKVYGDGPIDFKKRIAHRDYLEKVHKEFAEGSRRLEEPYMYSGENVHGIILSLYYGREDVHIVNIPNKSYCPGLKEDSVVEIPARVFKDGLQGIRIDEGIFAPHIISVLYNLNVIYDYTAEAAVTGDRVKASQALSLDPMVRSSDIVHVIPAMLEELLAANRKYLKAFFC
jgi:alpha-galactosidase/6-phospho-beta-glucosidase family protein